MPKIAYEVKDFHEDTLRTMVQANEIIEQYEDEGFTLTLRQLYYQFVARDLIPNKQKEYNRLGRIVNDGRMAGIIDWYSIEDRTRGIRRNSHYNSPEDVIEAAYHSYKIDMWKAQPVYVEVWIEKDALVGVIESICRKLDVTYFSCRGYVSQSEMWNAAQRLDRRLKSYGKDRVIILHLGDHDPSGIDMTRDISDRLNLFMKNGFAEVDRIALTRDQINEYEPPPNPAKTTDSRFEGYLREHGSQSWELDALEPTTLEELIRENVEDIRDQRLWVRRKVELEKEKKNLKKIVDKYDDIVQFINGNHN